MTLASDISRGNPLARAAGARRRLAAQPVVRIPPPLLALSAAAAQRALARNASAPTAPRTASAIAVTVASGSVATASVRRFRRAGTTLEPIHPDRASVLVTSGANAVTRNPMYLGLAGLLVANAIRKGSWVAVLPIAGFVAVVDRLQISAEESALRDRFGDEYAAYCRAVPRWLDRRSVQLLPWPSGKGSR